MNHHHGFHTADITTPDSTENGFFVWKFLINPKVNKMNWQVPRSVIKKYMDTFVGQPVVLTPDRDHPSTDVQDFYKVGTIRKVKYDEQHDRAMALEEITDTETQNLIKSGKIKYSSVTVQSPRKTERRMRQGDTMYTRLSEFQGMHDALVARPAYGKEAARVKAICHGTEQQCVAEFNADLSDGTIPQITIVDFARTVYEKRFRECTRKKAGDVITGRESYYESAVETAILRELSRQIKSKSLA